jgi:hypothetical protein
VSSARRMLRYSQDQESSNVLDPHRRNTLGRISQRETSTVLGMAFPRWPCVRVWIVVQVTGNLTCLPYPFKLPPALSELLLKGKPFLPSPTASPCAYIMHDICIRCLAATASGPGRHRMQVRAPSWVLSGGPASARVCVSLTPSLPTFLLSVCV